MDWRIISKVVNDEEHIALLSASQSTFGLSMITDNLQLPDLVRSDRTMLKRGKVLLHTSKYPVIYHPLQYTFPLTSWYPMEIYQYTCLLECFL